MSPKSKRSELLRCKDSYNRMSLLITWAHPKKDTDLKFERLRLDYGDLRSDYLTEKRKLLSEGLKI